MEAKEDSGEGVNRIIESGVIFCLPDESYLGKNLNIYYSAIKWTEVQGHGNFPGQHRWSYVHHDFRDSSLSDLVAGRHGTPRQMYSYIPSLYREVLRVYILEKANELISFGLDIPRTIGGIEDLLKREIIEINVSTLLHYLSHKGYSSRKPEMYRVCLKDGSSAQITPSIGEVRYFVVKSEDDSAVVREYDQCQFEPIRQCINPLQGIRVRGGPKPNIKPIMETKIQI